MIVDHRTYAVKPGKLNEYLRLYETEAYPLQLKYLGHNLGWYTSHDIGPLNQVVHLWGFDSLADREARRSAMAKDPAWAAFIEKAMPLLDSMENKILRPTSFFTPPERKGS
ncbi:MAG: NIPSNAP family protein [Burkholderiales bacterium]